LYLANIGGCRGCHGLNLSGGSVHGPPGTPPASNLTPAGIGSWMEADFVHTLRTGKRPNRKELHTSMPWRQTSLMTDDELHAIWLYVRSVPPRPFGNN
jgi:mono/diheme cytochrome c family protein